MRAILLQTDDLLRGSGVFGSIPPARRPYWCLPLIIVSFAPMCGVFIGSFGDGGVDRALQMFYSAVKLPLLLAATSVVCLPAFFVLNTILGLRDDMREAVQAILAGQAGLSIALASLSPLMRVFYCSTGSYRAALLFDAGMFAIATAAGHLVMLRDYRRLIDRRPNHRVGLCAWLVMYAFVGIQMGWLLRPFVGSPGSPVSFFRDEPFSNAYVVVGHLIFGLR